MVLFINACIRPDSRTNVLAQHLLNTIGKSVTTINIHQENLSPINLSSLDKRNSHDFSSKEFDHAKQFANADTIVIAAPYWDLSFPAALKIYLENVTVSGITFDYSDKGFPISKCNAKKLYYVTTSGGYIGENNFGFDYINALAQNFYGIKDVTCFSAQGLDIFGADVQAILSNTKQIITNSLNT